MKKIFNLAVILATLMGAATFTSCDDSEEEAENKVNAQGKESINVVEGGKYSASAEGLTSFSFKVLSVAGHYADQSQVVNLEIEQKGKNTKIELSDAGASYLMWTEANGFEAVGNKVADANAKNIVMVLACANSTQDYTVTSGTVNTTLANNGAVKTLFSVNN